MQKRAKSTGASSPLFLFVAPTTNWYFQHLEGGSMDSRVCSLGSDTSSQSTEVNMTVVVTDNCQLCRFTECVTVCPVSCFHGDAEMLYVDPESCIDCYACVDACPAAAIYEECDLPETKKHWAEINAMRATSLPVVDLQQNPLPTAQSRLIELGRAGHG